MKKLGILTVAMFLVIGFTQNVSAQRELKSNNSNRMVNSSTMKQSKVSSSTATSTTATSAQGHDRFAGIPDLTEDQKSKLSAIETKFGSEAKEVMNDTKLSQDAKKEKLKSLRAEASKEVNAVLTPAQREYWKEKMNENKERRENKKDEAQEMSEAVGLSDAQKSQMAEINAKYRKLRAEVNNNTSISQEDKQAKFKALNQQKRQEMSNVLTKEQKAKWQAYKKQQKANHQQMKGQGQMQKSYKH